MILELEQIETFIGQHHILQGVTLGVPEGEISVLLGRNGAGKTTTLRSIMGMTPPAKGRVIYRGEEIQTRPPYQIARKGIGYVPEDQGIFGDLTVAENFKVAMSRKDQGAQERLEWMLELFPDLKMFWDRKGGNLSGGQKQMLAIARALVQDLSLLLIDEPSKGLSPVFVDKVAESLEKIKHRTTIVLVEQNFHMASAVGDRFTILDDGQNVASGRMEELNNDEQLKRKYLGIA
ncbi:ABC transporter ATP-binding protein [Paenactinomyces guangxiensis]|uniref:ABC transporter ATP-binding protein n=1 Tax=Paenactinomyces guangxiensis TaxID=1490290 RepID=A0A7W1WSV6_9BACL|nr:ABC transporter ATP-binding protein [Paenactinomyces guangxiensis]MBA4495221.1 ABC transporter ATP-binding protein [Paenactinomyces guangxiensis]MBH8592305.1 ABC transporter ATP-binding protein [Paenactinomyces guangxiensis]